MEEFRRAWDTPAERLVRFSAELFAGTAPRLCRADLEPLLQRLSITRVAELTDLDWLSLPVWAAIRPASKGLSVSQGKGLTNDAAWVSAVLESAEQAIAEDPSRCVAFLGSIIELGQRGLRTIDLSRQSRCADSWLDPNRERAWVPGLSLMTGETVFAPFELVGMDMASAAPWDRHCFRTSSVGLGAGSTVSAATLQGLREIIEEDAVFVSQIGCNLGHPVDRSSPLALPCPFDHPLRDLIAQLDDAGMDPGIAIATDDIALPVVRAALRPQGGVHRYFAGSACRSTLADAALDAILEAVQSRLTFIAGARDDLLQSEYDGCLTDGTRIQFSSVRIIAAPAAPESNQNLYAAIRALELAGTGEAYAFPIGGIEGRFEVVRVLADDLASFARPVHTSQMRRVGARLLRARG